MDLTKVLMLGAVAILFHGCVAQPIAEPEVEPEITGSRVLRLHLGAEGSATSIGGHSISPSAPPAHLISVKNQKRFAGPPPKQVTTQYTTKHLVIVAADAQGAEISRAIIDDPRLIRGEFIDPTDPSGQITTSVNAYQDNVDFYVRLPDSNQLHGIKIYHPTLRNNQYQLDLVGEVSLPPQ